MHDGFAIEMPQNQLTDEEIAEVVAYIVELNGQRRRGRRMRRRGRCSWSLAGALAACGGDGRELVGLTRDPAPQVDAVALPDVSRDGEPFEFRAAEGGLLVVYFGYTNCPDVCPTTMADLRHGARRPRRRRGARRRRDGDGRSGPRHAGAHRLRAELRRRCPRHRHRRPGRAAVRGRPVRRELRGAHGADGEVEVGHTSYLFAVDDTGTLVLSWPFGTSADDLAGDLRQLLAAADDT